MQLTKVLSAMAMVLGYAAGTNIHANNGCFEIFIPDTGVYQSVCAGKGAVVVNYGHATIYGGFNGDGSSPTATASCSIAASWPTDYGDIYLGKDNCVYDSNGQNFNGECCIGPGATVANPYYDY